MAEVGIRGRVISQSLPLPALAELHAVPAAAPAHEAVRVLIGRAWAEHCDPVLVMAASTRDALTASVRDALGLPAGPNITSAYGARIELDDTVHPGTVLAYRWEEFEIIRQVREEYPDLPVYPTPPAEETSRG